VKILALIPARGGSKRIPGKNLRLLGGKPLVCWSIDVALGLPELCDILASTDDAAIAQVATEAGALVPWLRPAELATDTASSVAVALHALDWYERAKGEVDGLLLLQPTSPFRTRATVERGIALFREHGGRPVLGVSPAQSHPAWCFRIEQGSMRPWLGQGMDLARSQDLEPAYALNGAFYLIRPQDLRARQTFYSDSAVPLLVDDLVEGLDIDTEWDWQIAEAALDVLKRSGRPDG
jgi:CMP-N-acetylneuraminic acid synthetase